ncbi:hypothetical protein [Lacimicrobium alkaliphilum]|nr:hypothetical protein [Lacimicrobium alkaliphilum]
MMEGLSEPIFDKCKPRDGSEANVVYENDGMMKKAFTEQFSSVLSNVADKLISAENAPKSPLMESLQDLAAIASLDEQVKLHKVVLISDLIQHSDRVSFYKTRPKNVKFDTISSSVPDLFGVDIQIYWLLRREKEGGIQNEALIPWWERIFEEAGVGELKIMKVR